MELIMHPLFQAINPWSRSDFILSDKELEAHKQQLMCACTCLLYGVVALAMGFLNKGILQLWPYSNTLLTLQMVVSAAIVSIGKRLKLLEVRPFELEAMKTLLPVVFFYNANVAFALAGLQALNIPIFNAIKRLTPVLIIFGKFMMGDGLPSKQVMYSVAMIVIGCIIAGLGDLSFDAIGYLLAIASCVLQSTYLILVEKTGREQSYSSNEMLLYNAVSSLPVLLVLIILTGEGSAAMAAFGEQMKSSRNFLAVFISSLILGSLLNYSLFLCTLWNSALTTTVVGTMKAVVSTVLGFFLLGGVKVTVMVVLGVFVNTVGGVWYAVEKYKQKSKRTIISQNKDITDSQPILPTHTDKGIF